MSVPVLMLAHTPYTCIIFYGRGSDDVLSSAGIPFPSFDCPYKIAQHPDDLSALGPVHKVAQCCLEAPHDGVMLGSFNTTTPMTLSNKTFQNLANTLAPEVVDYIFADERWVDFMQEIVPDAVKDKLGDIDEDILYELSLSIMDQISLKQCSQ